MKYVIVKSGTRFDKTVLNANILLKPYEYWNSFCTAFQWNVSYIGHSETCAATSGPSSPSLSPSISGPILVPTVCFLVPHSSYTVSTVKTIILCSGRPQWLSVVFSPRDARAVDTTALLISLISIDNINTLW